MNTTGLGVRGPTTGADRSSRPGVVGHDHLEAGDMGQEASRLWECWLPDECPGPNWVRMVSDIRAFPPVMYGSLAAWFMIWSKHTPMKLRYMTSTTGRHALATPRHPRTEYGRFRDRRVQDPCRPTIEQPTGDAEDVTAAADVDPGEEHRLIALEQRGQASWMASMTRKDSPVRGRAF